MATNLVFLEIRQRIWECHLVTLPSCQLQSNCIKTLTEDIYSVNSSDAYAIVRG